jgi:catechol 2,3-dioxygenase-like lactoylglutathione lyase family enzyme
MIDHVTVRVTDRDASTALYASLLATLGIAPNASDPTYTEWGDFSIAPAEDPAAVTRRLHIGFSAPDRAAVDAFWHAGLAAGLRSDGEPGPRPQYVPDYYGAFLLDPDGNSIEAVHYDGVRQTGNVDHLWLRVADLTATRAFYLEIAPHAGLEVGRDAADHLLLRSGGGGSVSFLPGRTPTAAVHLAFSADEDAAVQAFHAAAVGAGYRDNGPPGERRNYHPGYYGAFVLDPDGHNVEVVNHHR